ncbi:GntR family transcriptional regulator [Pseudorhodoferax aquiterrae]|uniref:GntR family transcriptional regulator n=1 Tax=Pseudorhodoferax aquiterrae TaxID=747304 RepID=A0ABQ3FXP0_9BURK|nr:GntR family transcriptional regulator [Pseudorhodoferax aquiterrae]GHC74127.1 GntR family transcriptional regulator [Pseudorhodoferax aquiterrae]
MPHARKTPAKAAAKVSSSTAGTSRGRALHKAAKTPTTTRAATTATTGEQIAKQLGQAILEGRHAVGARVGEQAVAEMFSVSRGPVRDALRILERQGLIEIQARRGARVRHLSHNEIADIFNVRGVLLGLAVRYLSRNPDKSGLAEVDPRLAQLRKLAGQKKPSLLDFAQATGRVAMGLLAACRSPKVLQTTYRDLPHDALWRMLWVKPAPPDYESSARRTATYEDYARLLETIRASDVDGAEALMRKIMSNTRDEVLHYLGLLDADDADAFRRQVL